MVSVAKIVIRELKLNAYVTNVNIIQFVSRSKNRTVNQATDVFAISIMKAFTVKRKSICVKMFYAATVIALMENANATRDFLTVKRIQSVKILSVKMAALVSM